MSTPYARRRIEYMPKQVERGGHVHHRRWEFPPLAGLAWSQVVLVSPAPLVDSPNTSISCIAEGTGCELQASI